MLLYVNICFKAMLHVMVVIKSPTTMSKGTMGVYSKGCECRDTLIVYLQVSQRYKNDTINVKRTTICIKLF